MYDAIKRAIEDFFNGDTCAPDRRDFTAEELAQAIVMSLPPTFYVNVQPDLHGTQRVLARLDRVINMLASSQLRERVMLMKLDDVQQQADELLADVQAESTVTAGIGAVVNAMSGMIDGLQKQLEEAIANGVDEDKVQKLSDTLSAIKSSNLMNTQAVADAIKAGTPAQSEPTPPSDGGGTDDGSTEGQ